MFSSAILRIAVRTFGATLRIASSEEWCSSCRCHAKSDIEGHEKTMDRVKNLFRIGFTFSDSAGASFSSKQSPN